MTDTPGTLEERLRKGFGPHDPSAADYACLLEAADEIASLRARVEAAEAAQLNLVRRGAHFRNAGIRQAAELVEELSKRPKTQWGEVKASIIALQDTKISDDDEIPGWVYEIQYGPEGEANYAWVYDEGGRMIATMKTHDAARLAKPRQALKDTPDAE